MKIVALVPMKMNNRRLPNKNIKSFTNGQPLCTYILRTLMSCRYIDEIYVYCSNSQICEFIPDGILYLKRPISLDNDDTMMNEVLYSFAREVPADIYIMSHATAPFIKKESIERGVEAVMTGQYDSSFAARKIQDFIWKDGRPFNYQLDNIPRTQDLAPMYMETSGFYVYRSEIIHELKRRIGNRPYIVEVDEIEGCDIDEENDFVIADAIYNFLFGDN